MLFRSVLWLVYIALEPFARRRWPEALTSWSRLLAGDWRDPLVGRHILIGCCCAAGNVLLQRLTPLIISALGGPGVVPQILNSSVLFGAKGIAAWATGLISIVPLVSFAYFFMLFLFRLLTRRDWVAAIVFALIFAVLNGLGTGSLVFALINAAGIGFLLFILLRVGLLAVSAAVAFSNILYTFPLTLHFSAWYAGLGLTGLVLAVAFAGTAFYISLGGRPVFGAALEEQV